MPLFSEGARLQHSTGVGRLPLAAASQPAPVTVVRPAGVLGIAASVLRRLGPRSGRPGRRTVGALATIVAAAGAFAVIAAAYTVPTPITTAARI
ncbi:hypothetical protein FHS35_002785 [Streptomyces umbrinus]|uniref:hypothetical protein n=1 Tax=Streptomyces umbrinus TaxID=67370 RepID=UPI00167D2819|nr:hypothetical protein [Streptomyces umbrinus]MCR3725937.1 hypothetical protein [Streptomyces umbrinus]GHH49817.1 hypothetical protein GCM10018775_46150 [Streptomyces umbrinus]